MSKAWVSKRGGGYQVRWRDESLPGKPKRSRTFGLKRDADVFADSIGADIARGTYLSPAAGRITVAAWWERWNRTQAQWTPATRERYELNFAKYIKPKVGHIEVANVRPSDLQGVLTAALTAGGRTYPKGHELAGQPMGMSVSASKVLRSNIASLFTAAVADGLIVKSPGAALKLPKDDPSDPRPLDDDEIGALLGACDEWERAWVLMGLGTGVRISEGLAVRTSTLDFLRRSLSVGDQMPGTPWLRANPDGPPFAPLKNRKPRSVPLSDPLVNVLARHVEVNGTGPEGVLFPNRLGGLWRMKDAVRRFERIARDAELDDVTWHCLRDTAATKMLTAGMNPAAVAGVLGNTVPVLLTRYAGVLKSDTEVARSALESLVSRATG